MKHFICKGDCKGMSDQPGVCQTEGCSMHGQPLEECEWADNMHMASDKPAQESQPAGDQHGAHDAKEE